MLGTGKTRSPFLSPVRARRYHGDAQARFRRAFFLYAKEATNMAWRPYDNLIAGELDTPNDKWM